MRVISWNVNGVRAVVKKVDLNAFLEQTKPDFFCIGETKLSLPDESDARMLRDSIRGFRYRFYNTSKTRKGYSGVAVFSRRKPLSVDYAIGCAPFDDEGRSITMDGKPKSTGQDASKPRLLRRAGLWFVLTLV